MRFALISVTLLAACGPSLKPEDAGKAVEEAFARANPSGRTGMELRGKAVWFEAPWFEDSCLEEKDLAFNDDPATRPANAPKRVSPTYANQRWLTASTPAGYCVYLGSDPGVEIKTADVKWAGDRYRVPVTYTMGTPSPWFECVAGFVKAPVIDVLVDDQGQAQVQGDLTLKQGDCPSPLPGGEDRTSRSRPTKAPDAPPTRDEVVALARKLDEALYTLDFEQVRNLTMCYNLFEKDKFGTCSVAEFLPLGQSFKGQQRSQDGLPWMEYTVKSLDDVTAVKKDPKDPTLFHAMMKHKRDGREKSFSVQWVDGKWKMVGVVGLKAEGITHVRYVYDLHRPDRRDVFERRLAGEELDEHGNPPPEDPWETE